MDPNSTRQGSEEAPAALTRSTLLRRAGFAAGSAVAASALLSSPAISFARAEAAGTRRSAMQAKPNIILVHGAWADGSSWSKVVQRLQAAGHTVIAPQLDLASLADDIAYTRAVLAALGGPTVLVGHSYAGGVITAAAAGSPHAISLVYLSGFAPDAGETLTDFIAGFPAAPGPAHAMPDYRKGFLRVDPAVFPHFFAQDIPLLEARALAAVQKPVAASSFSAKVEQAAWHTLPSWYLVAEHDRMLNPDAERATARRIGATTIVVRGSSHASMISHPDEAADAIMAAAKAGAKV